MEGLSHREQDLQDIAEFRMFDDTFMAAVFDGRTEETQVLIRTILNRDDIIVTESKAEDFVPNLRGHEVRLDILAYDKNGNAYNFEVQRDQRRASPKRARYTGAMVDSKLLEKGEDYEDLHERYTIFIMETDYYGKMEPVYHAQNTIKELDNAPLGDGSYILYVNGEYHNTETPLGRLMHDFSCKKASDIINPVLRERVEYLKGTEGGHETMCDIMERRILERNLEAAKRLIASGEISLEGISKGLDLPLSTVEELASSMQKRDRA